MHIRSVDEWRKRKVEILLQEFEAAPSRGDKLEVKCVKCSGEGIIIDWGELTGQEFEAECNDCDGDGVLTVDESSLDVAKQAFTLNEFLKELESDLKALACWTRTPPEVVLSQHGFRCWSDIGNRTLCCQIANPSTFH